MWPGNNRSGLQNHAETLFDSALAVIGPTMPWIADAECVSLADELRLLCWQAARAPEDMQAPANMPLA